MKSIAQITPNHRFLQRFLDLKNDDEADEKDLFFNDGFDMMMVGYEDVPVAPDFFDALSFEKGNEIEVVGVEPPDIKKESSFENPINRISSNNNNSSSRGGGGKSSSLLVRRSSSVRAAATKRTNSMMVNSSHTDCFPATTDVTGENADEQEHVVAGKHHWLTTIPVAVDESTVELKCILEAKLAGGDQYYD